MQGSLHNGLSQALSLDTRPSSAFTLVRADWRTIRASPMPGSLDIFSNSVITAAHVFSSFAIRRSRSISGDFFGSERRRSATARRYFARVLGIKLDSLAVIAQCAILDGRRDSAKSLRRDARQLRKLEISRAEFLRA